MIFFSKTNCENLPNSKLFLPFFKKRPWCLSMVQNFGIMVLIIIIIIFNTIVLFLTHLNPNMNHVFIVQMEDWRIQIHSRFTNLWNYLMHWGQINYLIFKQIKLCWIDRFSLTFLYFAFIHLSFHRVKLHSVLSILLCMIYLHL